MTNLYLKIIDELEKNKRLFTQKGLIPPLFIDIWDGQLYNEDYEFVFPCIFFNYAVSWSYAGKTKMGTVTVELHVISKAKHHHGNILTVRGRGTEKNT